MKKVIPLVLSSALIVGGCATYTDDFYTPYPRSTSLQVGYHSGWPMYYAMPYGYYYRCSGIYGLDGRCYRPYYLPYVPTPDDPGDDDPVIPITQPPVMVSDDLPTRPSYPTQRRPDVSTPYARSSRDVSRPARVRPPSSRPGEPRSASRSSSAYRSAPDTRSSPKKTIR